MKLLNHDGLEVSKIDFGIVEVGKTGTVEYHLYNDDSTFVDQIQLKLEDSNEAKEISISQYERELGADRKTSFTLTWTPTLEIKKGLQLNVEVSYRRLWKPIQ